MRHPASPDALAQHLVEAAEEAARISRMVADSWWDERGREMAAGIARVGHELDLQAQRAARAAEEVAALIAGAGGVVSPAPRPLPGISGRRESEERGVRLPLLNDGSTDVPNA
ncbi:hypothetical protein [Pseudonocardia pini]|uniref:hypothetical protein n=1 Tax=Pseudonocardia pini TaxID=2758030 RepID=UPI0015F03713|nr:hypothetical protein [Pseudonocardia pini]